MNTYVHAIAGLISEEDLHVDYVIPDSFDRRVAAYVAATVAYAAMETGVSQKNINAVKNALNCLNLKYRAAEVGGTNIFINSFSLFVTAYSPIPTIKSITSLLI